MSDWTIGGLALPHNPLKARCSNSALIQEGPIPPVLPLLVSIGFKARKLTIEGWLFVQGQDKDSLETTYIDVYEAKVHTQVAIAAPGSRYDGNWLLDKFDYEEGTHRGNDAFYFVMVFLQGSQHVVFT